MWYALGGVGLIVLYIQKRGENYDNGENLAFGVSHCFNYFWNNLFAYIHLVEGDGQDPVFQGLSCCFCNTSWRTIDSL